MSILLAIPVAIFWFWLVVLPARVSIYCPEECTCDPDGYTMECNNTSFTAIPSISFTDVQILRLDKNNIRLLERDSFVSLTELETLNLSYCEVKAIELGAFNGLIKLTYLQMGYNKIRKIIPGTFENLSKLEELHLGYNRIEHIDSDVFTGLVKLNRIYLEGNKLRYLHQDIFVGLPNIKHISLHNNPNLHIPTDRSFINSHSLSQLDVSYCRVSSLSVETVRNVGALELLDLRHNDLKAVDVNILKALPKLSTLYLHANPLQCDCKLKEVWQWCQDRKIRTKYWVHSQEFDAPSEVKETWWDMLEKWNCLQVDIECNGGKDNTYSYSNIKIKKTKKTGNWVDAMVHMLLALCQTPGYAVSYIFGTTSNVILIVIIIFIKAMQTVPNVYCVR
jgi:hypothetical protein